MSIKQNPDRFICECDGCARSVYTRTEKPPNGWLKVSGTRLSPHPEDTRPWEVSGDYRVLSASGLYCSASCLLAKVNRWATDEKMATEAA